MADRLFLDRRSPRIRRKLLDWFAGEKRQLPWRGTKDPYRLWVSEVMLQQTTVAAVRSRYASFLERFPNVETLARAREETVVAAWSGLGYYSRARLLRRAARAVVSEHGGKLPRDPALLRALPGFGDYTAAAVASLAYGVRVPAADANVTRVLSRVHAMAGPPSGPAYRARVLAAAEALLPPRRPGDATAALMDLGQAICLPRRPRCSVCPLAGECAAFRAGNPERYPGRAALPPVQRIHLAAADARQGARTLLLRRPEGGWLPRMWEFPCGEGETRSSARKRLAAVLKSHGLCLQESGPVGRATHTIVRRRLEIEVFRAFPASARDPKAQRPSGRWFSARGLGRAAVSTLTRKIGRASGFLTE